MCSSANAYTVFCRKEVALNPVEGCALWHDQQTAYKGLLLAAFSGKAQIVQVAPGFMGFWFWGTSKISGVKVSPTGNL